MHLECAIIFLKVFCVCMCPPVYISKPYAYNTRGHQKGQAVVNCLIWDLGTKAGPLEERPMLSASELSL